MIEIGLGHYLSLGAIIFFFRCYWNILKQKKRNSNFDVYRINFISSKY